MLHKNKYTQFTTKELKPTGWLRRQLEIQAEGLSGNLHKIWPDIKKSKWIGGHRDGWERVPYWLDGFVPLAYLLDDEELIQTAVLYVDHILRQQKEDGWICPCSEEERRTYDVWPVFLICKVLVLYYECSGDQRIEEAVYNALKNLNRHIEGVTIFNWAAARWQECLISIYWLYERNPEEWMIDLCYKLYAQGLDYKILFDNWRFDKPQEHGRWNFMTHVVNIAMALKSEALISRLTGSDGNAVAKKALELLKRDHGMAAGHFTGDECLSGNSPIQGSECCSVVEAMYSYEHLIQVTGDSYWSDVLEEVTYNALPATMSGDMWTHQYDQMTNQVECSYLPEDHVIFRTNGRESHLFGLEPNFGCCTANFNQGWPKFALSVFMKSKDGIAVTAIAPAKVSTIVKGTKVECEIITEYPFRDSYQVKVSAEKEVEMCLELRIPGFCTSAEVNGAVVSCGENYCIKKVFKETEYIDVKLIYDAHFVKRPNSLVCVKRGPLVYSLAIEEEWRKHEFIRDGVERRFPYCDYEIFAVSKWNYGFLEEVFEIETGEIGEYPFSSKRPGVWLKTKMLEIDWGFEHGVCKEVPDSRVPIGEAQEKVLIPYGCTCLRLTEAPVLSCGGYTA